MVSITQRGPTERGMKRYKPSDQGCFFRIKATGERGQLEAPPLHDPTGTKEGEGILWLPSFGGDTFRYITREEVTRA